MTGFAFSNASKNLSFRSRATAITLSIAGLFSSIFALIFSKAVLPVFARNWNAATPLFFTSSRIGRTIPKKATALSLNKAIAGTALSDSAWINPVTFSVIFGIWSATAKIASFAIGAKILHNRIFASSTAEPKTAIAPGKVSVTFPAISIIAPSALYSSSFRACHSERPSAVVVFNPDRRSFSVSICVFPPIAASAAFRSSSVRSFVASLTSWRVSWSPMNFPSLSKAEIPNFFIIAPAWPVPDARLIKTVFNLFPASDPLIPRFASTPSAVALSSTDTPKLFRTPPQPIYASISCCAVWFDLLFALHATSR